MEVPTYSLGSTSLSYCPFGAGVCMEVPTYSLGSTSLIFFSEGSFGPYNPLRGYGHPMGTHVGTPMGHPLFKNKINKELYRKGAGMGVGGHDVATTCSLQTHPQTLQGLHLNFGLNYRAPTYFFFFF